MQLHLGDIVQTIECYNHPVTGAIVQLLEHTVIVAQGETHVVVLKKTLTQAGYTFPRFNRCKGFLTTQNRAEE